MDEKPSVSSTKSTESQNQSRHYVRIYRFYCDFLYATYHHGPALVLLGTARLYPLAATMLRKGKIDQAIEEGGIWQSGGFPELGVLTNGGKSRERIDLVYVELIGGTV